MSLKEFNLAEKCDADHPEVVGFVQTLRSKAEDMFRSAMESLEDKNMEMAFECLSTALDINPDDMKCLVVRASVLRWAYRLDHSQCMPCRVSISSLSLHPSIPPSLSFSTAFDKQTTAKVRGSSR